MYRLATVTVAAAALALGASPAAASASDLPQIAHRGLTSAKVLENTKNAIRDALKAGSDGVEIDIRLTKDKQALAMHDETLDRTTTCTGNVEDRTYDDIRTNCKLKTGEKIPNLYELAWTFSQYDGTRDQLWVHTKFEASSATRSSVMKALDKYKVRSKTVVMADEGEYLDDWKKWSGIKLSLIFNQDDVNQGLSESWTAGYYYSVPYRVEVTPQLVALARAAGSKVYGVENNFIAGIEEAEDLGLDGLLTES